MGRVARYRSPSPARLTQHILETPALVAAVRELPAEALGRLIDHVGLEDAGELVALATTPQLERVFDEDLWGGDDTDPHGETHFDARRFALWLEVLLEAGEQAVVERLCELPLDFVTLAVQRLVLVIDIDALGADMSDGGDELEQTEKALESCLYEEWEEFRLIARDASAWDTVLTALLALDREHHARLRRILERCCALSQEYIDDNGGLYEVLTSDEMLEGDARAERDDRRAALGYVAPSDARSFLALARQGLGGRDRDAVTRAYFRELDASAVPHPPRTEPGSGAEVQRLLALLGAAGVVEPGVTASSFALPAAGPKRALDAALIELRDVQPELYAERLTELSYLANVLVSGHVEAGRRLRPVEAIETALAACELGLRAALRKLRPSQRSAHALSVVQTTHLDRLFREGWHAEHSGGAEPVPSAKRARPARRRSPSAAPSSRSSAGSSRRRET